MDHSGTAELATHRLKVGPELTGKKVVLRLDGHLVHVVHDGVLAKTLPSPIPASSAARSAEPAWPPLNYPLRQRVP